MAQALGDVDARAPPLRGDARCVITDASPTKAFDFGKLTEEEMDRTDVEWMAWNVLAHGAASLVVVDSMLLRPEMRPPYLRTLAYEGVDAADEYARSAMAAMVRKAAS